MGETFNDIGGHNLIEPSLNKNTILNVCSLALLFAFSSGIYATTTWQFTNSSTGKSGTIQTFVVPSTGAYKIEAYGAEGGPGATYAEGDPGNGAKMTGTVNLNKNDVLQILVGQMGSYTSY